MAVIFLKMHGKYVLSMFLVNFLLGTGPNLVVAGLQDTQLTEDYKQFLEEVKPTLEENISEALQNEALRDQQGRKLTKTDVHKLHNVLLSIDDSKIELMDLKFPWLPEFQKIHINVDLSKLNLDVGFKLGTLKVEGKYETNNAALHELLPISSNGKVVFTFKDVITQGRIGLLIVGDSFVPENYDIRYEWQQSDDNVQYYVSSGSQEENKIASSGGDLDKTLVAAIWKQLNGILTDLLDKQLREAVVQFSVCETLADEDQQLREVAQSRSEKANKILDSLLFSARDYILQKKYQSVETPPLNAIFRGKMLETEVGFIRDLSTLSRLQDLSLYEEGHNKLLVYGSLNLRQFKHGYEKYSSKFDWTEVSGNIKTTVDRNKICIKLSVEKVDDQQSKTTVEKIQVSRIDDIDVEVSGLGSLSWLTDRLQGWVIGNLQYSALRVLEKHIQEAFNYAIEASEALK